MAPERSNRFPWFPLYVGDWRMSETVRAMSYEQRGVYLELLCIAWGDGAEHPTLPANPAALARLTALGSRWAKIGAPIVAQCFEEHDGRLTNPKLSHVWDVQRARYELKAVAGRAGGKAKAQAQAKGKQNPSTASRPPSVLSPQKLDAEVDRTKNSSGVGPLAPLVAGAAAAAMGRRHG